MRLRGLGAVRGDNSLRRLPPFSTGVSMTFDGLIEARNDRYLMPCVWKAIQTIEMLRNTPSGLRVNDLQEMTGYSRVTIYRILRTLTLCGYTIYDCAGLYRLNQTILLPGERNAESPAEAAGASNLKFRPESDSGFELWGVRFHAKGRR